LTFFRFFAPPFFFAPIAKNTTSPLDNFKNIHCFMQNCRFLIKFVISNQSIVLDRKNNGLPKKFLNSIPYFNARLLTRFGDCLKKDEENIVDISHLDVELKDVVLYFRLRKCLFDENNDSDIDDNDLNPCLETCRRWLLLGERCSTSSNGLPIPTGGVFCLIDFLMDEPLLEFIDRRELLDLETILGSVGVSEEVLSRWCSNYIDAIFLFNRELNQCVKRLKAHAARLVGNESSDVYALLRDDSIALIALLRRRQLAVARSGIAATPTHASSIDACIEQLMSALQSFVDNNDNNNNDNNTCIMTSIIEPIGELRALLFGSNTTLRQRVLLFVRHRPTLAELCWSTLAYRRTLVASYLKLANRKQRRFVDAPFDALPALVDDTTTTTTTADTTTMHDDDRRAMWQHVRADAALRALQTRYRAATFDDAEVRDALWHRIAQRKATLVAVWRAARQRDAPRGPLSAGWFV
jgi:hypothetical protein